MNEVTYFLAILVKKDILSMEEAYKLRKALRESVTNDNLKEMIEKVDKALEPKVDEIETLDASKVLG